MMFAGWKAARSMRGAARRRWSSTVRGGRPTGKSEGGQADVGVGASRTTGVMRIRRADTNKDAEVDSTIARIIGSDWGDRRGQRISLPMRIYWVIFGVVLANGAYTYFTGKDESFIVEKLRKKVDDKVGKPEASEFEVVATGVGSASSGDTSEAVAVDSPSTPQSAAPAKRDTPQAPAVGQPASIFHSQAATTPSPFFSPGVAARRPPAPRPQSKAELEAQLVQLRQKQQSLKASLATATAGVARDNIEFEVRMIDEKKEQLKRTLKQL